MEIKLEKIDGSVERIIYSNEESGYSVVEIKKSQYQSYTIFGNLSDLQIGESIECEGSWIKNSKYGEQFKVEKHRAVLPSTNLAIEKYLGSGLVKGIGPVMAARIVKKFKENTFDIIEGKPEKLCEVEGIGDARVEKISKAWKNQQEIRQIILFLQQYEISTTFAAKIYKRFKAQTILILKENPYKLAEEIDGIGFKTADKMALKLNIGVDSPVRLNAAIIFVLNEGAGEGNVYLPKEILLQNLNRIISTDLEKIENSLELLKREEKIIIEGEKIYLPVMFHSEKGCAKKLRAILEGRVKFPLPKEEELKSYFDNNQQINFAQKQKEAIIRAISTKITIITGGPGTGKTTITRSIINILKEKKYSFILASPTGKAAKRLKQATGENAKTIHRLLEFSPGEGGFKKNQENLLAAEYIIIDEASMIDIILMNNLLKAVKESSVLIFIGDIYQLPSVGPGSVLKDMINSGCIPVVTLNEIFRQGKNSKIVVNAHRINEGLFPYLNEDKELTDFYFINCEEPAKVIEVIKNLVKIRIPERFKLDPLLDIQVLSPMNRGAVGTINLNLELQRTLNNSSMEISKGYKTFKVNDKVMQLSNNYEKMVFNGDVGIIEKIDKIENELTVNFDGRKVTYESNDLDELVLAYAVSVHKFQGSESPCIIFVIMTQHFMLLQRNLLYTAVTRGKKLVILVGSKKALAMSVKNDKVQKRFSYLSERIRVS